MGQEIRPGCVECWGGGGGGEGGKKEVTSLSIFMNKSFFRCFFFLCQILMNAPKRHPTVTSSPPVQTNLDPIPASVTVDLSEMALIAIIVMPVSVLTRCSIY